MEAALQCLLDAGMSKPSAVKVVEALFQNTARAFAYAGKRSRSGLLAHANVAAVKREIDALTVSRPLLAEHYRQAVALAASLVSSPPEAAAKTHG